MLNLIKAICTEDADSYITNPGLACVSAFPLSVFTLLM